MGRRGAAGRGAGKKERPPEGQEGERAARSKLGGFGAFQLQLELVRDQYGGCMFHTFLSCPTRILPIRYGIRTAVCDKYNLAQGIPFCKGII